MAEPEARSAAELERGVELQTGDNADLVLDDPECEEQQDPGSGPELYEFVAGESKPSVVEPRVKLLAQFDPRWARKILHSKTTWVASGCHPTTVAMVLRWIAEDDPRTQGKFKFPSKDGSQLPAEHHPLRMCEAFWPELGGQVKSAGGKVDHTGLRQKAEQALGMAADSSKLSLSGNRLETVKRALARGPVVCNMTSPGHFVVIQGFQDGKLHIVDGGRELDRFWRDASQKGPPTGVGAPASGGTWDRFRPCYVSIDAGASYDYTDGKGKARKSGITFLSTVILMESFYLVTTGS